MKNAMGVELSESERALVECYQGLVRILKDGKDLAPFERRNALKAVAALWQVVNGLDLDPGQLYEIGACAQKATSGECLRRSSSERPPSVSTASSTFPTGRNSVSGRGCDSPISTLARDRSCCCCTASRPGRISGGRLSRQSLMPAFAASPRIFRVLAAPTNPWIPPGTRTRTTPRPWSRCSRT